LRFIFPVEGLVVPSTWPVGVVRVEPIQNVEDRLGSAAAVGPGHLANRFEGIQTVATLDATDVDEALQLTAAALGVLRVYQHAWTAKEGLLRPTGFGLPGEARRASVTYAQQGEDSGFGWRLLGGHVGFTFVQAAQNAWEQSVGFQFLAGAVGAARPCESQRRALLAADLLSHSILSHRPAAKVISVVQALEALLLPRDRDSQTFRLARYVAFFGCGFPEGSLCGRDRPTCMYLADDPARKADRASLTEWQARADADPRWRCSEWEAALDLYATRSALVHGEDRPVGFAESRTAEYWVGALLLPPILEWLSDHADDPAGDLEAAVAALPAPMDWEAQFRSADSGSPTL
jgi:hypothetical protein